MEMRESEEYINFLEDNRTELAEEFCDCLNDEFMNYVDEQFKLSLEIKEV